MIQAVIGYVYATITAPKQLIGDVGMKFVQLAGEMGSALPGTMSTHHLQWPVPKAFAV